MREGCMRRPFIEIHALGVGAQDGALIHKYSNQKIEN